MSILVTGGGTGIGAATAAYFVARGARVTISGRRPDRIHELATELGDACRALQSDVTVASDRSRLLDCAVEHGSGLDALVNNAGNMYSTPIDELDEQRLTDVFRSNVVGPLMLTSQAIPHLERRSGAVIFLGSVHTLRSYPGASPYASTKGAIQIATRVLAAELGVRNIRVSCVIPGAVPTELIERSGMLDASAALQRLEAMAPQHPLGRIGTPEEIAEAIAYLVCAEWTTGAILPVDGGLGLGATALK
jgi:NAD(P)-dependent dehydrogenase (short-subunit alcohol dehydrogenase family)